MCPVDVCWHAPCVCVRAMYADMLRVYKHYYFALSDTSVNARGMSFSSYPGVLWSIDDFYMLSSGQREKRERETQRGREFGSPLVC